MLLRWLIGKPVSWLIMPSQLAHEDDEFKQAQRVNRIEDGIKITSGTVPSSKGAQISYSELVKDQRDPVPNEKIIIFAVGNSDFYENHMADFRDWANRYPEYRIVGFNFRGTIASTGSAYSEEHWIDDACAIVEHYRSQGVPLENILLNGHSMGGALLTMAAARIYKSDCEKAKKNNTDPNLVKSLKLINNRSFSNLADELIVSILGKFGSALIASIIYGILFLGFAGLSLFNLGAVAMMSGLLFVVNEKISQALLKPWVESLVWLGFGRMDAASAYKSLPPDCVDHIVAKGDAIIKDRSSLHHALRSRNAPIKADLKRVIVYGSENEIKNARETLLNMKDCKVRTNNDGFYAHNADLSLLRTYHGLRKNVKNSTLANQIYGSQVMEEKVQRLFKVGPKS